MPTDKYKYDVAFSFLAADERIAVQLNDLIQDRVSTFIYSENQKEIAGTDGERKFNEVFREQSRIVVVLFHDGWGDTPWTRIEQTAIRNRAYEDGYDFTVFIPLDESAKLPDWVPKTRLWVGLERWGLEGAASVIEARVQETGGSPREESFEERAFREKREIDAIRKRKEFLGSERGIKAADAEVAKLYQKIESHINTVRNKIGLSFKCVRQHKAFALISDKFSIRIVWHRHYANTLDNSELAVTSWRGYPPGMGKALFEDPTQLDSQTFHFDRDRTDEYGWLEVNSSQFYTSQRLGEFCVFQLIEKIREDEKRRS